MRSIFTVAVLLLLSFNNCLSQSNFPDLSPKGFLRQKVGFTTIEVSYERPAARGRAIMGGVVPFDKLWRTGAGNCTKIKVNQPIEVGGKKLNAGAYSLFTIPGAAEWTVILNADTTLYGADSYNQNQDLVRFKVKPEATSRYYESLTIDIDFVPYNAELYISWEKTQIHFAIKTESDQRTTDYISQMLLTNKSTDADEYATAAEYYFTLNRELDQALTLINSAIQKQDDLWYFRLKIDILEKQKRYQEAIQTAHHAIDVVDKKTDWDAQNRQRSIEQYRKRIKVFESSIIK